MQHYFNEEQIMNVHGAACTLYFSEYKNSTIAVEAYNVKNGDHHAVGVVTWDADFVGNDYNAAMPLPAIVLKKYCDEGIDIDEEIADVI